MARTRPATILLGLLASTSALADPDPTASQLGFGYCPPPVVPGCIASSAAHRPNHSALEACSRDVLRFTQTLGTYRACLTRESERAIGTGNTAIARFRCIAQGGAACR